MTENNSSIILDNSLHCLCLFLFCLCILFVSLILCLFNSVLSLMLSLYVFFFCFVFFACSFFCLCVCPVVYLFVCQLFDFPVYLLGNPDCLLLSFTIIILCLSGVINSQPFLLRVTPHTKKTENEQFGVGYFYPNSNLPTRTFVH